MIWWEVHCNYYLCSSIGKFFVCCSVYFCLTTFKVFSLFFYLCLSIPFGVLWTSLVHRSGPQLILESSQSLLQMLYFSFISWTCITSFMIASQLLDILVFFPFILLMWCACVRAQSCLTFCDIVYRLISICWTIFIFQK